MTKLTGKGGPGRGQGRHPKAGKGSETRTMVSVRLPFWLAMWLKSQPVGQRTELIEEALIRQYNLDHEALRDVYSKSTWQDSR